MLLPSLDKMKLTVRFWISFISRSSSATLRGPAIEQLTRKHKRVSEATGMIWITAVVRAANTHITASNVCVSVEHSSVSLIRVFDSQGLICLCWERSWVFILKEGNQHLLTLVCRALMRTNCLVFLYSFMDSCNIPSCKTTSAFSNLNRISSI